MKKNDTLHVERKLYLATAVRSIFPNHGNVYYY